MKGGVTCCFQYERQHEKEQTQEMTEKLDQEWKDIRLSMGISKVWTFVYIFFVSILNLLKILKQMFNDLASKVYQRNF